MDDAISHFENQTGKSYAKTRAAMHGCCDLAKSSHFLHAQVEELKEKLATEVKLHEMAGEHLTNAMTYIENQKLYIKALEEKPAPLLIMEGSVLLPVEPPEEILWRMSGRPNGPSFPEMRKHYQLVIKAAQEE